MRHKILFCICNLLFYLNIVSAQQTAKYSISGKLKTIQKDNVPLTQVKFLEVGIRKLVKIESSDADGGFTFENLSLGKYQLVIESLLFEKFESETIELRHDLTLKAIELKEISRTLNEVSIAANKPLIQLLHAKLY